MTSASLASTRPAVHSETVSTPAEALPRVSAAEAMSVALLCAVVGAALSFAMGRDLNWDYFNYHGYAAFDVFGTRLTQDFFPAGYQGYLNRLPYLPLAWMTAAGWHSIGIATMLALLQSLNAFFLYLICRDLTAGIQRAWLFALALLALGVANGAFLQQVGSTFVDPLTTVPLMAGLWLVFRAGSAGGLLLAGGALAGMSVALKLTNAPFALALLVAALVGGSHWRQRGRSALMVGLGSLLGFLLLYAHWAWKLTVLHGSPVFPLFNQLLHAPDFPAQAIIYNRFIPLSLWHALRLPFEMAEHRSYIYNEGVVPDIRPAVLVCLCGVLLARMLWRRVFAHAAADVDAGRLPVRAVGLRMAVFCGVATLAWLLTSANGRYATPLLLLLSPLLFVAARSLAGDRVAGMLSLLLLAGQLLLLHDAGNPRWSPQDWTEKWVKVEVPANLQSAPHLYVSTATTSESYIAAHVHPASAFTNPIGLLSIPNDGPGWDKFVALRDRFAGRIKVMFPLPPARLPANASESRIATMNGAVDRLGLTIRRDQCQRIVVERPPAGGTRYLWGRDKVVEERVMAREVAVCPADITRPSSDMAAARRVASEIFDAYERKCPKIFAPGDTTTEGSGRLWSRLYGKHDLFAMIDLNTGDIMYRLERQTTDVVIGRVSHWQADLAAFNCRLPHDGRRDISTLGGDAGR